ncbi:hypothetical protein [Allomesorhizobium alhagi]|uniref:DUF1579 domain-containing protein n=1 Tax=Mesorhizobium alhagi CCNWXJ12-2 TaxID=1107882 RepID=H0HY16_9HYPH|nr:hypothetical protein [Mesorhizobium alhagi]EHK54382.1 hypothetical protein MAXJ12_25473 [Mesorhizobium alhagi CCNWXJ12-2]
MVHGPAHDNHAGPEGLSRRQSFALAAYGAVLATFGARANAFTGEPSNPSGSSRDFDFQSGHWRVAHRSLRRSGSGLEWQENAGSCVAGPLLGGNAHWDDHVIHLAGGAFRGATIRAFNSETGRWAIWWLDSREPDRIEPPMIGGFRDGIGTFFGDTILNERPTKIRFLWTRTDTPSPRWEQAYSSDGGASWQTVWTMDFARADAA